MKHIEDICTTTLETYSKIPSDVKTSKHSPLGRIVKKIISQTEFGAVKVTLPTGETVNHFAHDNGPFAEVEFLNWRGLFRYIFGGELAFAESYLAGDVNIPRLSALFKWFLLNEHALRKDRKRYWFKKLKNRFLHLLVNDNSKRGSRKNIAFHYDLGNKFYQMWLDPTMTYSSADFSKTDDLEQGQRNKYQRIVDSLNIQHGDKILEIGCGWGGFGKHVLERYDVKYRGVTISQQQHDYASDQLKKLSKDTAPIRFQDYRETSGKFDKIVSIEMFEAVGEKHWVTYFDKLKSLLEKDGKATIQVITINPDRFEKYRNNVDFIQKYTFPGGMLPTEEIFEKLANKADLKVDSLYRFGRCYAETLRRWRDEFIKNHAQLEKHGLDERFYRMWRYYLEYCEVGFDHGTIDVAQFTLSHDF